MPQPLFGKAPPVTNEPAPPFMGGGRLPFSPFPPHSIMGPRPGMLPHPSWGPMHPFGPGRPPFGGRMPQRFGAFPFGDRPPLLQGNRPPFQPRQQVPPRPARPLVDERAPARN